MGDHPELWTMACTNIAVASGYYNNGEANLDPWIEVLEADEYGRILFIYSETDYYYYDESLGYGAYICVMQKRDDNYVYYYPDICYQHVFLDSAEFKPDLTSNEVIKLKEENDWNDPLNESLLEKRPIETTRPKPKLDVEEDFFEEMVYQYFEDNNIYIHPKNYGIVRYSNFVTSDEYERELYTVYVQYSEYTDKKEIRHYCVFLVVVNPDNTSNQDMIILLKDPNFPQEETILLKERSGWNTPLN